MNSIYAIVTKDPGLEFYAIVTKAICHSPVLEFYAIVTKAMPYIHGLEYCMPCIVVPGHSSFVSDYGIARKLWH